MFGDEHDPIRKPFEKLRKVTVSGKAIFVSASDEEATLLQKRAAFVEKYSRERGWDMLTITVTQILEIRGQEGWKNPV